MKGVEPRTGTRAKVRRRAGLCGTSWRRAAWRRSAGALLGAAVLLGAIAACGREERPAYGGDPEGRIVTAGETADELVSQGATARRIAEVKLSAGLVERWFAAQARLDELAWADGDMRRLLDGRRDDGGGGGDAISDAARRLEHDPRVRDAIERSGLSAREFVMTALALHQALLAASPGAPRELRALAARNVSFVGRNSALLERLAAPPAPRTLAYGDGDTLDGPFIDTAGVYDAAPYDATTYDYYASPYSTSYDSSYRPIHPPPDSLVAIDTARPGLPSLPDTLALPPVILPPAAQPGSTRALAPRPRPARELPAPAVPQVQLPPAGSPLPSRRGVGRDTARPVRPDSAPPSGVSEQRSPARSDTSGRPRPSPTQVPAPLPTPPPIPASPPPTGGAA